MACDAALAAAGSELQFKVKPKTKFEKIFSVSCIQPTSWSVATARCWSKA